ncbi:MAG: methyltransferase domain-containing protein [Bacteroidota bacterium]
MYHLLKKRQLLQGKILHFSPPLSLYQKLRQITTIQYVSSDYENEFVADQQYDLTDINLPDASVNLFIAYHVLEHIEQDSTAMRELFRITKNGGQGLIQTPFKSGEIYEDFSIRTPADRLRHFGQHDHVRIYSVQGLVNRLTAVGFTVEILQFQEKVDNIYGFKTEEIVLEVHK